MEKENFWITCGYCHSCILLGKIRSLKNANKKAEEKGYIYSKKGWKCKKCQNRQPKYENIK